MNINIKNSLSTKLVPNEYSYNNTIEQIQKPQSSHSLKVQINKNIQKNINSNSVTPYKITKSIDINSIKSVSPNIVNVEIETNTDRNEIVPTNNNFIYSNSTTNSGIKKSSSEFFNSNNLNELYSSSNYRPSIVPKFEQTQQNLKYSNQSTKNFFKRNLETFQTDKNKTLQTRAESQNKNFIERKKRTFTPYIKKTSKKSENDCVFITKIALDDKCKISNLDYKKESDKEMQRAISSIGGKGFFFPNKTLNEKENLLNEDKVINYENDINHINGIEIHNSLIFPVVKVPKFTNSKVNKLKTFDRLFNKTLDPNFFIKLTKPNTYDKNDESNKIYNNFKTNPGVKRISTGNLKVPNSQKTSNDFDGNFKPGSRNFPSYEYFEHHTKQHNIFHEIDIGNKVESSQNNNNNYNLINNNINQNNEPKTLKNREISTARQNEFNVENIITHSSIDFDSENKLVIEKNIDERLKENVKQRKINPNSNYSNLIKNTNKYGVRQIKTSKSMKIMNTTTTKNAHVHKNKSPIQKTSPNRFEKSDKEEFMQSQVNLINERNLQNQNALQLKINELAKSKKNNKISHYQIVMQKQLKEKLRVNKFKLREIYDNSSNAKKLEDFRNFEYNLYKQGLNLKKNLDQGVSEILIKIFGKEQFDKYANYIE